MPPQSNRRGGGVTKFSSACPLGWAIDMIPKSRVATWPSLGSVLGVIDGGQSSLYAEVRHFWCKTSDLYNFFPKAPGVDLL